MPSVDIALTADLDNETVDVFHATTLYGCPGDEFVLRWGSGDRDVTRIEIDSDVEDLSLGEVERPRGSRRLIVPERSAVFRARAFAPDPEDSAEECVGVAVCRLIVVERGTTFSMVASQQGGDGWTYEVEIANTRATASVSAYCIQPTCGAGCATHNPPISGYNYLGCSSGDLCNVDWLGQKTGTDFIGFQLGAQNAAIGAVDEATAVFLGPTPLAGSWSFRFAVRAGRPHNAQAHFLVGLTC